MNSETIYIPDIGASDEVEVIEVSVEVGQGVTLDQTMIVLESDKTTMDIPAPKAGVIKELLLSVGDKVTTGSPIMNLLMNSLKIEDKNETPSVIENIVQELAEESFAKQALLLAEKACAELSESQNQSVFIPDIGTDSRVLVIEVSVSVGDVLEKDQTMLVLESDKSTMEIPTEFSGVLKSLEIKVGDEITKGELIGVIESSLAHTIKSNEPIVDINLSSVDETKITASALNINSSLNSDKQLTETVEPKTVQAFLSNTRGVNSVNAQENHIKANVYAGPAVRRLAREMGVPLQSIKGTSPKGRISKDDIKAYVKNRLNQPVVSAPETHQMPTIDFSQFGDIEEQPLNRIKQATARNMTRSWHHIPMVTQFDETDITELEHYRKEVLPSQVDTKVTMLAFVVKAVANALEKFPQFNSSLNSDGKILILKKYINIGIAVETPQGLMVPVIKDVNHKTVVDIAQEASRLAKAARDKKLPLDAMQGGCFSISSLGGIGGTQFTPIVNSPEVAILGLSKSSMKPYYDPNIKSFTPRLMLPLSLTYDHRVVDGAEAARFTVYISSLLKDIRHLLL
jgi:pyruvate dehydrogenase E2 component (dihydrolipoamide acetyltransferase)